MVNMHTLKVMLLGTALLALCLIVGKLAGSARGAAAAALIFVPLWFIGSGINLYLGVKTAGYSFAEELPVFLLVFAVPSLVALVLWRVMR